MNFKKYIKTVFIIFVSIIAFTTSNLCVDKATAEQALLEQVPAVTASDTGLSPHSIVANPKLYLNKVVKFNAKFDKFATLGLDYKPAFKSSEEYISFLIKRNDTVHDIPLSELKLFLKRDVAEKFIDLKLNDEIEITGIVFSDALGDAWVDVSELKLVKKAPEKKDGA